MEGRKKEYEYEVKWKDKSFESNSWITKETLLKYNKIYEKVVRLIDQKISNKENMASRPLNNGKCRKTFIRYRFRK